KVSSDLHVAEVEFSRKGRVAINNQSRTKTTIVNQITQQSEVVELPSMTLGGVPLYRNFESVDWIKNLIGGTATVFQLHDNKLIRVSTNVIKLDGERAVGTYIPDNSPVYKAIVKDEVYYGRAFVVTGWYMSAYKPIKDQTGKVIGALFVGVNEKEYQDELLNELSKVVVGKTGYIFITDQKGNYILSQKRQRDGENIWNSADASGNKFIQEMITKAGDLADTSYNIHYYKWLNKGDIESRLKITGVAYFRQWDWIIGVSAYQDEFLDAVKNIQRSTLYICLISIILGAFLAYIFAMYMANNFKKLASKMGIVANGDLTVVSESNSGRNEIAEMSASFGSMLENLKRLVQEIYSNSSTTAATAGQLSASTEEINSTTEQISLSVDEIAKGSLSLSHSAAETKEQTDELINSIKTISSLAASSVQKASEVNSMAKHGSTSAKIANEKMVAIKDNVNSSGKSIEELVEKSKQINKVIEVITRMSNKTDLLALNAAIEAARAGEAGKGFGVVAGEIRKLAEESQKSASQIDKMINEVVATVENVVTIMQASSQEVEASTGIVNDALLALDNISQNVLELTSQIEMINNATEQQLRSSELVQESISAVSTVAEESAAASEEVATSIQETRINMQLVASSAHDLAMNAEQLRSIVLKFKTNKDVKQNRLISQASSVMV
ncbi:MAG TPA: Cache 3/Cache 2 fusion domain-containing protein, partial [Bacteroidales bacterium]|nr:Cache 3/Cache 2 fusion domain-containing protein [Bacteroidales bacterium]